MKSFSALSCLFFSTVLTFLSFGTVFVFFFHVCKRLILVDPERFPVRKGPHPAIPRPMLVVRGD